MRGSWDDASGYPSSPLEYPWCLGVKAVPLPEHLGRRTESSPTRRLTDFRVLHKRGPHRG